MSCTGAGVPQAAPSRIGSAGTATTSRPLRSAAQRVRAAATSCSDHAGGGGCADGSPGTLGVSTMGQLPSIFVAGAGATVGKSGGPNRSMKSGLGSYSITLPNGLSVGAIVAVNAVGDIIDPDTGKVVAGVRNPDGTFADARTLLRSGSDTEMTSGFGGEEARLIAETPGIEQGPDGVHASPELFVIVGHPLKRSGTDANVPLRGVTPAALSVRPSLRIVEGRMFTPGTNEIVVGKAASRQFMNLTVGTDVRWGDSSWKVVGVFDANGSVAISGAAMRKPVMQA